jgi:hypothetical protein
MLARRDLGGLSGSLDLFAQFGDGLVLLLQFLRCLLAGRFLLAYVLLQTLHFGLVLGDPLVDLGRLTAGGRGRLRPTLESKQATQQNQS